MMMSMPPTFAFAASRSASAPRAIRLWMIGTIVLTVITLACVASLPYTLGTQSQALDAAQHARVRYDRQALDINLLPPTWSAYSPADQARLDEYTRNLTAGDDKPSAAPTLWLGTDALGRDFLVRVLLGGAISLAIGFGAAAISVIIGTLWGTIAGFVGGRLDALMMRIVDVLYGLPYILLVVLLAVGVNGLFQQLESEVIEGRAAAAAQGTQYIQPWWHFMVVLAREHRQVLNIFILFIAIGGVSWLTMARVIRGQVLSLKAQPFMEACRAIDVPFWIQLRRHLLPNLMGPIVVYATLTVPQAILQESFLSFLGIGVAAPLPSWGNLAAEGLAQLNTVHSRWWLLFFPCLLLALTLLALNFVGEGLREAFDPRRRTLA